MLLLRAVLLEFLVCFHIVGAAVLFRRLFPRESSWLAVILPTLAVMFAFNFIEHFIALPQLGWLLPITIGGLLWSMVRPGYSWEGLKFPIIIFLFLFSWSFLFRCLSPEITCNTEGVADMARVLDFCLGDKLPPTDVWCPPYDHGGYYTFQHYGASLLKRLFSLDIGTGYNMAYALLNALTIFVGTGAAYVVSGKRMWVAVATMLVLLGSFTGSLPYLFYLNPWNTDTRLSYDIGDDWLNTPRNPFGWIFHREPPALRLFTPAFNIYTSEFHANLGGHFVTLASVLAANLAFREERSNWPWVCLLVLPLMTLITSTWFFIVVSVFCAVGLGVALGCGRRPDNWRFVLLGAFVGGVLIWPSVDSLISANQPNPFSWTWNHHPPDFTPLWEFTFQWWPVFLPWLILCFIWHRLSPLARGIHIAVPLLYIFVECATFSDRGLTAEKMWGAIYGAALVTFLPLLFVQRGMFFRVFTGAFLILSIAMIGCWTHTCYQYTNWDSGAFHLTGDTVMQDNPQKKRMLQVLKRLHAATVLSGRSVWAYNDNPSLVNFSENRCYVAWFYQEFQCGHALEADKYRNQMVNNFYDGKMADPLPFLRSNDIAAVLIYPEDDPKDCIPDNLLQQFQTQLASDYFYIDCKDGGDKNAGIFLRLPPH